MLPQPNNPNMKSKPTEQPRSNNHALFVQQFRAKYEDFQKQPVVKRYGSVLKVLVPLILGIYAIVLICNKIKEPTVITTDRHLVDLHDSFLVNVTCTYPLGCVIFYPTQAYLNWRTALIKMKPRERRQFNLTYDSLYGSLVVAPRQCWYGSSSARCSSGRAPMMNDVDYWQTQFNGSQLPVLPVTFSTHLGAAEMRPTGPIWKSDLKFFGRNDTLNNTEVGVELSNIRPELDIINQDMLLALVDAQNYANPQAARKEFLSQVCQDGFIPTTCTQVSTNIMESRANFHIIGIDSTFTVTAERSRSLESVILEIAGQIGGAYSLLMYILGALYQIYMAWTGAEKRMREQREEDGDQEKPKPKPKPVASASQRKLLRNSTEQDLNDGLYLGDDTV